MNKWQKYLFRKELESSQKDCTKRQKKLLK